MCPDLSANAERLEPSALCWSSEAFAPQFHPYYVYCNLEKNIRHYKSNEQSQRLLKLNSYFTFIWHVTNYLLWRVYVSKLTCRRTEKYVLIDCHNFESSLFRNSVQNPAEKRPILQRSTLAKWNWRTFLLNESE